MWVARKRGEVEVGSHVAAVHRWQGKEEVGRQGILWWQHVGGKGRKAQGGRKPDQP